MTIGFSRAIELYFYYLMKWEYVRDISYYLLYTQNNKNSVAK